MSAWSRRPAGTGGQSWYRYLHFWRHDVHRDTDVELRLHFDLRRAEYERQGLSQADAESRARAEFGDVQATRAELRTIDQRISGQHRRAEIMGSFLGDLRYAARTHVRYKGFTLTALITLVGGIAAVTGVFSYANAVYFASLPYKDANRLVALDERRAGTFFSSFSSASLNTVKLLREGTASFERVAAYQQSSGSIIAGAEPRVVITLHVDSAFIPMLGLRPEIGRNLRAEEIAANAPVTMISFDLWRSAFGGEPGVLDTRLAIGTQSYRVVGVLPAGFRFPYQTDAVMPLREATDSATALDYALVAKLRPGVDRATARAEIQVVARRLTSMDPHLYRGVQLRVQDEALDRRGQQLLPLPSLFIGAGLFVLLIACSNVANLMLARSAERRREMAVRASMGASRGRLVRQTLTETLLLGIVSAALGTVASLGLVRLWLHFVPTQGFPSWFHVSIDWHVLAFAIGITFLVTTTVGLLPAQEGTRFDLTNALKQGGDGGAAARGVISANRRGLAVQLAFSVALFASAVLLVRSYQRLTRIDLGYPAERIALVQPFFDRERYPTIETQQQFIEQIAARAATLPGVTAVSVYSQSAAELRVAPGAPNKTGSAGRPRFDRRFIPDHDTARAYNAQQGVQARTVGDQVFSMLRLRVRQGRTFGPVDVLGGAPVAVVNALLASKLWPGATAVGHVVQVGAEGPAFTVIGVVDDEKWFHGGQGGSTADPLPMMYLTARQAVLGFGEIIATGPRDALTIRRQIVNLVHAADPTVVIFRYTTMASQLDEGFLVTRIFGGVIGAFALCGLALAIVGIYGVIAFGVTQRTREIGIRIALGAAARDVVRLITVDGLRFAAAGLAIGLLLALGLGRLLRVFLYQVSPVDPLSYIVVCVVFGFVAVAACYVPALRATRVDPLEALRSD